MSFVIIFPNDNSPKPAPANDASTSNDVSKLFTADSRYNGSACNKNLTDDICKHPFEAFPVFLCNVWKMQQNRSLSVGP